MTSVVGSPRTLRVKTAWEAAAHKVGEAAWFGLRGDDVSFAALWTVSVGLLQSS